VFSRGGGTARTWPIVSRVAEGGPGGQKSRSTKSRVKEVLELDRGLYKEIKGRPGDSVQPMWKWPRNGQRGTHTLPAVPRIFREGSEVCPDSTKGRREIWAPSVPKLERDRAGKRGATGPRWEQKSVPASIVRASRKSITKSRALR